MVQKTCRACIVEKENGFLNYGNVANGIKCNNKVFKKGEVVTVRTTMGYVTRGKIIDISNEYVRIDPDYAREERISIVEIVSVMR